ncbi:MAG TPA: hypothetical protein VJ725_30320 [Thermoanaerobaculia bacterium]|nr:hypothetical protein [Thermoanaerobaculia bacterium]
MNWRVVSLMWVLFFAAGVSRAATLTFNPANPQPTDTVEITVLHQGCSPYLETSVDPPAASAHGSIRIDIADTCACVATPLPTPPLKATIGPLPAGTYTTELYQTYPECSDSTGTLLQTGQLVSAPGMLLQNGRFNVRAVWDSPEFGSNEAHAVQLTRDSGYFWFAGADNVELVAKVLNGCGVNNRYWVFLAGLTNVSVTVTVDDTVTGETQSYTNALGTPFLPVQDTDAFEGCSQ